MSETRTQKTYEDGYREGFKDGFDAARKSDEGTRGGPLFKETVTIFRGCQCPPGAELSCGSTACGRRGFTPDFGPMSFVAGSCSDESGRN